MPYCREGGETPGVTENWGTVTLSYDEAMGTASVMNWTGTGATTINKADGNGDKIFIATFSFNTAGSNGSKPGFSSKYSESIRAGYVNRNAPSFRGSYIEKTSTTDLNTGKTANCEFKYQLWGGTGDVPQDSSEPYDPSLLSIIVEKLKPFILDNTRSRNTTPVTKRTAALGVRG